MHEQCAVISEIPVNNNAPLISKLYFLILGILLLLVRFAIVQVSHGPKPANIKHKVKRLYMGIIVYFNIPFPH